MGKKTNLGTSKSAADKKKELFADEYLSNGGNATQAAIAIGYSKNGAYKAGYRLSKDAKVMAIIEQKHTILADKYAIKTEDVIKSLSQELNFDPINMFNEDGTLKNIVELDEDTRKALTSFETVQVGSSESPIIIKKVKWANKTTARDQAMKYLGMYEKDNKQSRPVIEDGNIASRIADLLKKGKARKDGS